MQHPWTMQRRSSRQVLSLTLGALLLGLFVWGSAAQANMTPSALFPIPEALRPNVAFWKRVFAGIDTTGGMLHDMEDLSIIYHIWYSDLPNDQPSRQAVIDEERNRYRAILETLAEGKRTDLTSDEQRVWDMFPGKQSPEVFQAAMGTMRFQGGMRSRFAQGLIRSWSYLPEMEAIFAAEGVPIELTRLPHVESSFENRALSKVGAAGIWQFMPATGRRFMRVNGDVDDRLNIPIATQAAARLLRENYEKLGTWPLAITAYNHGANGMKQAVAAMGTTDFGVIVKRYRGPLFGFASQNFYAEFLAALDIATHHKQYFGDMPFAEPSRSMALEARIGSETRAFSMFMEPSQPVTMEVRLAPAPAVLAARAVPEPTPGGVIPSRNTTALPQVASNVPSDSLEDPVIDASTPPIVSTPLPLTPPAVPGVSSTMVTPPARVSPAAVPAMLRPSPIEPPTVARATPTVSPAPVMTPPRAAPVESRPQAKVAAATPPPAAPAVTRRPVVEARPTPPAPAAAAPAAPPVLPPAREEPLKEYKVRPGDTLFAVARRHGTTVATVAALNRLHAQTNVKAGQTLLLPAPPQTASSSVVASADKPSAKGAVVPVASPFRGKPALPIHRALWSEVTPVPTQVPVPVPAPRGKNSAR